MTERKIALVTGASRGIGLCCAKELAKAGCDIIINDICTEEQAKPALDEIKACGVNADFYSFDVSNFDVVGESITKIIEKYGKIDVLINNAGITKDGLFVRMTPDQWEKVIDINLGSVYCVSHHVIKHMMKARQGSIVNMASVVGVYGNPGQANYSASKAGIIGATKAVAVEVARRGITCNVIAPGVIETDMTKAIDPDVYQMIMGTIPMNRAGKPEEIASLAVYLLSEGAAYITRQVITVDGGM